MITEDYVNFETAKLLKEKGFDEYCKSVYHVGSICSVASLGYHNNEGYGELIDEKHNSDFEKYDNAISAPTLQMAMKWLREKYYIYADPIKQGNYNDCSEYYTWIVARMGIIHRNPSVVDKLSYKQAAEAALKYALENLI